MKIRLLLAAGSLFSALALSTAGLSAQTAPDNTKVNKSTAVTADKAKDNAADRELMQKIRKSIMDDKSLSTYGHNVKVISQSGMVTLKGPVRSEEEKKSIGQIATDAAGADKVTNELTIKPAAK